MNSIINMEAKKALVKRLGRMPEDDILVAPAAMCLAEQQLAYEFQQLTAYTTMGLDEMSIPKHNVKESARKDRVFIRPHSAPPGEFGTVYQDPYRLFSYIKDVGLRAKTELMLLSLDELSVLFRMPEKLANLKRVIGQHSTQYPYHSQDVLVAIRRMIHGSNVVEAAFSRNASKENKVRVQTTRRLKYILSNLYSSLSELETMMGITEHQEQELGVTTDTMKAETLRKLMQKPKEWQIICRSSRKRFIDLELAHIESEQSKLLIEDRRSKSRELSKKQKEFLKFSQTGYDTQKREAGMIKRTMVCRICERKDIPMNKCQDHTKLCKDLLTAKQDLLKINKWLLQACKDAEELKKDSFKLSKSIQKKPALGTGSTRSNDREIEKDHGPMTPNVRIKPKNTGNRFVIGKSVGDNTSNEDTAAEKDSEKSKGGMSIEEAKDKFKARRSTTNEFIEDNRRKSSELHQEEKKVEEPAKKAESEKAMAESDSDKEDNKGKHFKPSMFRQKYKQPSVQLKPVDNLNDSNSRTEENPTLAITQETAQSNLQESGKPTNDVRKSMTKSAGSRDKASDTESADSRPLLGEMFDSDSSEVEEEKEEFDYMGRSKKPKMSNFLLAQMEREKRAKEVPETKIEENEEKHLAEERQLAEEMKLAEESRIAFELKIEAEKKVLAEKKAKGITDMLNRESSDRNEKKISEMIIVKKNTEQSQKSEDSDGECFADFLVSGHSSDVSQKSEKSESEDSEEPAEKEEKYRKSIYATKAEVKEKQTPSTLTVPISRFAKPESPKHLNVISVRVPEKPSQPELKEVAAPLVSKEVDTEEGDDLLDAPGFMDGLMDNDDESENSQKSEQALKKTSDAKGTLVNGPATLLPAVIQNNYGRDKDDHEVEPPMVMSLSKTASHSPVFSPKILSAQPIKTEGQPIKPEIEPPVPVITAVPALEPVEDAQKDQQLKDAWKKNEDQRKRFVQKSSKKESLTQYQKKDETTTQGKVKEAKDDDFHMVKVARGFLEEIANYGKNIQKHPYGENSQDDIAMLDTLKKIVNNEDFSVQIVKNLAEKILEHVEKRFQLVQQVRKIEAEDAKLLNNKMVARRNNYNHSFSKKKAAPESNAFSNALSSSGMINFGNLLGTKFSAKLATKPVEPGKEGEVKQGGEEPPKKLSILSQMKGRNNTTIGSSKLK